MGEFQAAKQVVRRFYEALDGAQADAVEAVLATHCAPDLLWRGVRPFDDTDDGMAAATRFWRPVRRAFSSLQRREQIFFAGVNHIDGAATTWVVSMGHLLGLFDAPFLGVAPTRKATFLRYAEFHRIEGATIQETTCHLDVMDVLAQAGVSPLQGQTGAAVLTPGPRTQDGLLHGPSPAAEGARTMAVMNAMLDDLIGGGVRSPADELARSWTTDMTWFGPAGIGTTFTRDRYRAQHAGPFEDGLAFIRHHGHRCRVAEGAYSAFFGHPSMTLRMLGGFMGFPACDAPADMRIVDVYRREGDQLAENWIFIDLPHFFHMQGVDLLAACAGARPG